MNFSRVGVLIAVLLCPAAGQAQKVTELKLSPATEPSPALRWRLIPPEHELHPGNAASFYLRAALMARSGASESPEQQEERRAWASKPMLEFPVDKVKHYLQNKQSVFREMDHAARCRHCDWQLDQRLKTDGFFLNLDDMQACRELANLLSLQIRVALAEDRFTDALHSLQTGFAMARHLGQQPTLIVGLIGSAVHAMMCERVEELIGRPNSPNLYWALTALPRPFIDIQASVSGEILFQADLMPPLKKLESGSLSNEEAIAMFEMPFRAMSELGGAASSFVPNRFALAGLVAANYARARRELIAEGMNAEQIEKMPAAQVVALASTRRYLALQDNLLKWTHLPWHEAIPGLRQATTQAQSSLEENKTDVTAILFQLLMPALERVMLAYVRAERRVAVLRAIEATRLHAGANQGELPNQLTDVTVVPIPNDPLTDEPIGYRRDDEAAFFLLPPPEGENANQSNSFHYRVTIRNP